MSVLMIRSFFSILILIMARPGGGPTTWYVDDNNCHPGPGTGSFADPFCMVQAAIHVASNGDEIIVLPGVYIEEIDLLGKAVLLRSTDPSDPNVVLGTVLDGSSTFIFHIVQCINGEGPDTIIDGFTITNGNAPNGPFPDGVGAGFYLINTSPTIRNCVISGNVANNFGAAVYSNFGSPSFINCMFEGNSATIGGAVDNRNNTATYTNCTFSKNSANSGGAMRNSIGSPTFTDCTFFGNEADDIGGGIYNGSGSTPTFINCTLTANSAVNSGGAMYNDDSDPTIIDCLFTANSAGTNGGAINNSNGSDPLVTRSTFACNTAVNGAGMYSRSPSTPTITDSAFRGNTASNTGGGLLNVGVSPLVSDCQICGNSPDQVAGSAIVDLGGNIIGTLCPPPLPSAATCPGDNNDDGQVNVSDLLILLGAWGVCP